MRTLWQFAYSLLVIPFLWTALRLLGLFNAKVRRGIAGRRGLFADLARRTAELPPGKRVWFHSSSMGEFEQAKPIIAALKRSAPEVRIIVSFFSPSGYEHSRKYPHADVICYLPLDTRRNARRFLDAIGPDAAVFIRYDVWPNHVWELRRRGIPSFIASATMRRQSERRMPVVRLFHHHVYDAIDEILTVSRADVEAFRFFRLRHPRVEAIGDTRFDQVTIRSTEARKHTTLPPGVTAGRKVLVAGSSWPEDEAVLLPAVARLQKEIPDLLTVLVPHEPTEIHLEELERELNGALTHTRFSELNEYAGEQVVVVDSIGILLRLYAHAHVAYIGGSFRQGVHNVLEAAVYGIPVVFGPKHRNSQEPLLLVERGGAFVVADDAELERTLRSLLTNAAGRERAGASAAAFVAANTGATERFLARLMPRLGGPTFEPHVQR
jgi:3-deoxy-D-manno-octulosonic-acid transferase